MKRGPDGERDEREELALDEETVRDLDLPQDEAADVRGGGSRVIGGKYYPCNPN